VAADLEVLLDCEHERSGMALDPRRRNPREAKKWT
jgi:hypothetical protein